MRILRRSIQQFKSISSRDPPKRDTFRVVKRDGKFLGFFVGVHGALNRMNSFRI